METTERIVESYVRYVKGWATIPNIRCKGQREIDILAIDPVTPRRYHIEVSVSVSGSFSKLTDKPFDPKALKNPVEAPSQTRTMGYFIERKFGDPAILDKLRKYDFRPNEYTRVIVSWGWTPDAEDRARREGIELWDFPDITLEMAKALEQKRDYFEDDTLRTLHLLGHAQREAERLNRNGKD